jgi:hypothetical protein
MPTDLVTIRFYPRDAAGNEVISYVIVIKTSSAQQPPSGIPGYDLCFLIFVISVISVVLVWKR